MPPLLSPWGKRPGRYEVLSGGGSLHACPVPRVNNTYSRLKLLFIVPLLNGSYPEIHLQQPCRCKDVARNDIFSIKWRYYGPKGDILDYWGTLMFFYYPIISYPRIKVYRVEKMDMGGFRWNNCFSGRYNPSKYCGIIVRDENSLVGVLRYLKIPCR